MTADKIIMTYSPAAEIGPENVLLYCDRELVRELTKLLYTETDGISILAYQFSPPSTRSSAEYALFFAALRAAPRRHRNCRMIIANVSPLTPQAAGNQSNADILRADGWHIRTAPGVPLLHSKAWLIGDDRTVIGSHNLTEAAFSRNRETSLITSSRAVHRKMLAYFDILWAKAKP